jgi:3-methyladenine DNA glycosylase Tag
MKIVDIVAARLANQRLARPDFLHPADVVRWFGAMQAQDLRGALYAISLRMVPTMTESQVEQAIEERAIVRSWPMRGTLHLMAAEDARWMVNLLGPRLDAKAAGNYRRSGLSADVLSRAGGILSQELHGGNVRTRPELYAALAVAGVATGMQNGEQRGSHILGYWARHGLIFVAARRGKQQTFALLDEWLPPGQDLAGDAALAELARRYFTSHGPATIKDFMWWSGLTSGEATRGLQQNQSAFEQATVE